MNASCQRDDCPISYAHRAHDVLYLVLCWGGKWALPYPTEVAGPWATEGEAREAIRKESSFENTPDERAHRAACYCVVPVDVPPDPFANMLRGHK